MGESADRAEIWIMGIGERRERGDVLCRYLQLAGYRPRIAGLEDLASQRPLGVVLDVSPFSADGWGVLLALKSNADTRDIPVMPVFLSHEGRLGGVFPVAGFFTLPLDAGYLARKLTVLGLVDDADDYDLQALLISRSGEESVSKAVESLGFHVDKAYTGTEGVALATTDPHYLYFCVLMLPDMTAFELLERFRLYPQTHNVPFFVLLKGQMSDGERSALSRQVAHLVRKKELSAEEFIPYLRRRD